MKKQLLIIASSTSGNRFNTVETLTELLKQQGVSYDIKLINNPQEAYDAVIIMEKSRYAMVAPFGGDGTVIAVIKAALKKDIPVFPLPGGSANAVARSVGIDMNIKSLITAVSNGAYITRRLPIAESDIGPLVLDMHFGLFSNSVRNTPTKIKQWIGEKAYSLNVLLSAPSVKKQNYTIRLDEETISESAYACFVVNMGSLDIMGAPVLLQQKPGYVQVLLVYRRSLLVLLQWYVVRRLTGRNLNKALFAKYAKEATLLKTPEVMNYDDQEKDATLPLRIKASQHYVTIVVPRVPNKLHRRVSVLFKTAYYRNTDQMRRHFTGVPSERFSRVDKQLYLGGQYGPKAVELFNKNGITAIVSMRTFVPRQLDKDSKIEILHLPTKDMTAPSIENLLQGIAFMNRHIKAGGSIYVHCRLGEGRGPTMAAAYLVSTGMRVEDAIAHLRHYRPFARPNKDQIEVLRALYRKL